MSKSTDPLVLLPTFLLFINLLLWPWPVVVVATSMMPSQLVKPNCTEKCGNITVPYPFGFTEGCYREQAFQLSCNNNYSPPKLMRGDNLEVKDLSYQGQMSVYSFDSYSCYNSSGPSRGRIVQAKTEPNPIFTFSDTENKLTALGCDTIVNFSASNGPNFQSGCSMFCTNKYDVIEGNCSGVGCCQISIPKGIGNFDISLRSFHNHSQVLDFNPCSYAFVGESNFINYFSLSDLLNFTKRGDELGRKKFIPLVYDWAIDGKSCEEAMKDNKSYACGNNSFCLASKNGVGYSCKCSQGYEGNPYLQNGCHDADECDGRINNCTRTAKCKNLEGGYHCYCPFGYRGDGLESGIGCIYTVTPIASGIAAFLFLPVFMWFVYWAKEKRRLYKLFQKNGGKLLKQQTHDAFKFYTTKELKKATQNFNEGNELNYPNSGEQNESSGSSANRGVDVSGEGQLYRGKLTDGKLVAIKKYQKMDKDQIIQFVNEIDVLYPIQHENVVKLLGCCLDTEDPMLVFEFVDISAGNLFQQIHHEPTLSWKERLRIAAEAAGALAYLHSSHSPPIFHWDFKSSNILLDGDEKKAKVSFEASRLVPLYQTQRKKNLPRTDKSDVYEFKSDVYKFGVVLAELLTGKKPNFLEGSKQVTLAEFFVSSLKDRDGNLLVKYEKLRGILDARIVDDGKSEQFVEVAKLATECLKDKNEDRPTMEYVAEKLHPYKINVESEPSSSR